MVGDLTVYFAVRMHMLVHSLINVYAVDKRDGTALAGAPLKARLSSANKPSRVMTVDKMIGMVRLTDLVHLTETEIRERGCIKMFARSEHLHIDDFY